MRATLHDNKHVYLSNITDDEESVVWDAFSISDPNAYVDHSGLTMWDGVYRKYNRARRRLARPLLKMLYDVCLKHGLPLEVVDERPKWDFKTIAPEQVDENFLPGIVLDQHQIRAIRKALKIETGVVSVPTGGGKGEIIAGICKAIECPTVIVAEQKVVIDQLKARLEMRQIDTDIGLFYAGKRPSGQTIVVGSIQSLQTPPSPQFISGRKNDESEEQYNKRLAKYESSYKAYKTRKKNAQYLQSYVKKAEMIIVDECDRATSDHYKKLFRDWYSGRRRYGFSGTPTDPSKPVEALVMQEHLGPIIAKETRQHLQSIGRIIACDYTMMAVGPFDGIKESSAYDIAKNDHMVESAYFHKLVAGICKKYQGDGSLVLVDREPLGFALIEAMQNLGLTANFIYGKTPKKRRDELIRQFEERKFDVLIGGKIVNRGLDLKGGCENLIIATGGKLQSEFEQKVGRAVRHNKRGHSRVFDFFFRCNKYLYAHSKARLSIMVQLQYNTSIVFPKGSICGEKLIQSRYRVPNSLLTN